VDSVSYTLRYLGKGTGSGREVEICGWMIPSGWVITRARKHSACSYWLGSVGYTLRDIGEGTGSGREVEVCVGSPIVRGWDITGTRENRACGGPVGYVLRDVRKAT
jgi:uncharacterized protein YbdZ (MbtH family)